MELALGVRTEVWQIWQHSRAMSSSLWPCPHSPTSNLYIIHKILLPVADIFRTPACGSCDHEKLRQNAKKKPNREKVNSHLLPDFFQILDLWADAYLHVWNLFSLATSAHFFPRIMCSSVCFFLVLQKASHSLSAWNIYGLINHPMPVTAIPYPHVCTAFNILESACP